MSTDDEIVSIVERKLALVLREVDSTTEDLIRSTWSAIGPSPSCPSVGVLMQAVHQIVACSHKERGRAAEHAVLSTLKPFGEGMTGQLVKKVMVVVGTALPDNAFLPLVEQTPGIYRRQLSSTDKFRERLYSYELSLMSVSAKTNSRQAIRDIQLALDELFLQETMRRPSLWKRLCIGVWKIASSLTAWIFTIITALVIAALSKAFGLV